MVEHFEFERSIVDLEEKILALEAMPSVEAKTLADARRALAHLRKEVYGSLSPWQTVQIARHPGRPTTLDYIRMITTDFIEIHGDRGFADDPAIVGGLATLGNQTVMMIGQQKGHDSKERVARNFGMPRPEGYRKALRLMKLAERFSKPIVCLIDTPGAYPGIEAEERGQAEAIARN
ncbi:MAG: acetyl-CoA carboxylase carboxyl transferase subunit alpha, partial [Myxococcales bacterium]|nr:acetyl-CoA carboxylase carboxyl transferase subunit alpha [Myxococcales bacterium]